MPSHRSHPRLHLAGALLLGLLLPLGLIATPATAAVRPLPTGTDVDYQLGGAAPLPDRVGIVARDRTDDPAVGAYNVCYVNGFQTQPNEKRFWLHRERLLLHRQGRLVKDENWGEWLLDVRTSAKRRALAQIVGRWIAGCARDGFDAVEFDNLDSFSRSHRRISRDDALAFARTLVRVAHRHGLAAGQKNLAGYDGTRIGFDFAVAESCGRWDECDRYVRHFGDQVVMIEYRDADFRAACRQYGRDRVDQRHVRVPIVRRDRSLRPSFTPRWC